VPAEDTQSMPKRLLRERRTSYVFFPAHNKPDIEPENTGTTDNVVTTTAEARHSAKTRQPPKRLIKRWITEIMYVGTNYICSYLANSICDL